MARLIVGHPVAEAKTSHRGRPGTPATVVDLLETTRERLLAPVRGDVDHLAELRGLIRRATEAERAMTTAISSAMDAAGVSRLEGAGAVALLERRTTLHPDPELFLEAAGTAGYAAVTVSVTTARRLMAADDLAAISEVTTNPVLRVAPLERGGAA